MDDVVLGGEKREIDRGSAAAGRPNKSPFVVAVETSKEGYPLRLLLAVVKSHDGEAIEQRRRQHQNAAV